MLNQGQNNRSVKTRFGWLVPAAVSVAVAILVHAYATSLYPTPALSHDALGYTMTAQRLVQHHVFSWGVGGPSSADGPNALVTPGHVGFLAAIYALAPGRSSDPTATVLAVHPVVRSVQFALALLTVALIAGCGLALGGKWTGYLAGLLAAAYLPFAWSTTVALSECLAATLVSAQLLLAILLVRPNARHLPWLAFGLGLTSAALVLVRPVAAFLVLIPLIYVAARKTYSWKQLGRVAAFALAGLLLLMTPWWVRNAVTLHRLVPLSDGAGNPMLLSTGGYPLSADEQEVFDTASGQNKDPEAAVALYRLGRGLREDPLRLLGSKVTSAYAVVTSVWVVPADALYDQLYDSQSARIEVAATPQKPTSTLVRAVDIAAAYHVLVLIAALFAVVFVRRAPVVAVIAAVPLYFIVMHSFTLFTNRYFFPAMPAVILLAAIGVYGLGRWVAALFKHSALAASGKGAARTANG